jgi:hypothetical protein
MILPNALLPAVLLAQLQAQAPSGNGFGWGWAVILVALAIFMVAIFGGLATLRRRGPPARR